MDGRLNHQKLFSSLVRFTTKKFGFFSIFFLLKNIQHQNTFDLIFLTKIFLEKKIFDVEISAVVFGPGAFRFRTKKLQKKIYKKMVNRINSLVHYYVLTICTEISKYKENFQRKTRNYLEFPNL